MNHRMMTTTALLAALGLPALAHPDDPQADAMPARAIEAAGDVRVVQDGEGRGRLEADRIVVELAEPGADRPARVVVLRGGDEPLQWHLADEPAPAAPMVRAAYLGVNCEPVDADTAKLLGVPLGTGLGVGFVVPDSPAAAAGLRVGDVLTRLNDQLLVNAEQLAVLIRTHAAGDAVTLHVLREGEPVELTAELVERAVPELGPGGAHLSQQWRVQQNQPIRVIPGGIDLQRLDLDAIDAQQLIERMMQRDQALVQDDIRERMELIRQRMQQHRLDMDQMMQQIRLELDLDLHDLRDNIDPAPNAARMQSKVAMSDGEHQLKLTTDGQAQHLTITDAAGGVLFDGELPDDGQIEGLPEDVQGKVDRLLDLGPVQMEMQPAPDDDEQPRPGRA